MKSVRSVRLAAPTSSAAEVDRGRTRLLLGVAILAAALAVLLFRGSGGQGQASVAAVSPDPVAASRPPRFVTPAAQSASRGETHPSPGMSPDEVLARAAEGDPVGQTVPLLAGKKRQAQKEMLLWLAGQPSERVVFQFPHLVESQDLSFPTKVKIAADSLVQLSAYVDQEIARENGR